MVKNISGERFLVSYRLKGNEKKALSIAKDICLEQTVEFPEELINDEFIKNNIMGKIESFNKISEGTFKADISFAVETSAFELTQFINVIFGNISLKPGIRIVNINLPIGFTKHFNGPKFGIDGLRRILNIHNKPIIASALKPMGMSTKEFAELAYLYAKGGINIIKDDHGLSNQSFSLFKDRVRSCTKAIAKADIETGNKTLYFPNITAPFGEILERADFARNNNAGGFLISPAITGFDCMKHISVSFDRPIMSHPAFAGVYISGTSGFTHGAFFGQLTRLAGADAVVYPNFGGRFSFTKAQCRDIVKGTSCEMAHIKKIFPAPGGGMNFSNIPEMASFYGKDVIYLMGGGLFKRSPDLVKNCKELIKLINS
jgi:ribulose-bisphosphate carboxylase large chain